MNNYAWVTLLSSCDYVNAILVLHKSLQIVKSDIPLYVALTDIVFKNDTVISLLKENNIQYRKIPALNYNLSSVPENNYVKNTASKFQIFAYFQDFKKIVYIDADSLFLKNADELFFYPDGSMLKENFDAEGNTRLMVIEPNNHNEIDYYISLLQHTTDQWDGTILGKLWFFVKNNNDYQIPDIYSKQVNWENKNQSLDFIKILHYKNFDENKDKVWKDLIIKENHPLEIYYKTILSKLRSIL